MRVFWTSEEDQILLKHYGEMPFKQISTLLPGRTRHSIKGRARSLGIQGNVATVMPLAMKKYSVDCQYFSTPTLENSYWAGFIAADGCISPERRSVKITLAKKDVAHLACFADSIGYDGPIFSHNGGGFKPQSPCVTLNVCGVSQWIEDLEKNFHISARKTFTSQPPVELSAACQLAFIVGYLDGDGSIYYASSTYKSTTYRRICVNFRGTKEMLTWIQVHFDRLVPPNKDRAAIRDDGIFPLYTVVGNRAELILHKLLSIDVPRMERKWLLLKGD